MTAPVSRSPERASGSSIPWVRLPELDRLLRDAGLPAGIDRWQNAQDLIAALAARHRLPADPQALRALLAPLFCRSPEDQRAFATLFDQWLGAGTAVERTMPRQGPPPEAKPQRPPPSTPLHPVLAALALLVAAVAAGLYLWLPQEPATKGPDTPIRSAPPTIQPPPFEGATDYLDLPLEPLPPRSPPEMLGPGPDARRILAAADWLVPALPLILAAGLLAWRRLRRQDVLRYRKGDADSPLRQIALAGEDDDLFTSPRLRTALRRLHTTVPVPTRRLNERATADRTARNGGLFVPVYLDLPRVPELVVLLDFHHRGDHLAGLAETLLERLRAAGVEVHRYLFQRHPARVRGPDGRSADLAEIAARHAGARLLIVGDPAVFVDPWSDRPADWIEILALWPQRGLLSTRGAPALWRDALEETGLACAPFGEAGMMRIAGHLSRTPAVAPGDRVGLRDPLLPGRLSERSAALDEVPDESGRSALLARIDAWLGPRGGLLLAAVAVYPELNPGLTRRLDLALFPADSPEIRAQRLLRLARLPWLRAGRLPEWLRIALSERTGAAQTRRIGDLYRELLRQATVDGEGAVRLSIALPGSAEPLTRRLPRVIRERRWRLDRWIRDLAGFSGVDAPLRDRIFLDTVLRPHLLDFRLPRRLTRLLPRRRAATGWLPAAGLALVLGAGLHLVWQGWDWRGKPAHAGLRTLAGSGLQALGRLPHGGFRVEILHTRESLVLAERLAGVLAANGFDETTLSGLPETETQAGTGELLADPGSSEAGSTPVAGPRPVNSVQLGSKAAVPPGAFIADRLRYLAWGNPPVTADRLVEPPPGADPRLAGEPPPPDLIRVWLATTGHGGVFADPFERLLTAAEREAFRNPEGLDLPEPTMARAKAFEVVRDRLRDGSQGPAMLALPAGSFLMGSPGDEPERWSTEGPQRRVSVPPFAIGRTEVTFAEYDRFAMATGREQPDDAGWGRGDRPVINVSWEDAAAYAAWLSAETGRSYRLPTEAEWEYAARAGTGTPFWTGDCIHTDQANYDGNSDYNGCGAKTGVFRRQTVPAGSLPANPWGLHEVAGNVWEWVQDCWHDDYEGAPAGAGARGEEGGGDCARRVVRGGGWGFEPGGLRSAYRRWSYADVASYDLGFRLARDL